MFVSRKSAGVATPATDARTVSEPAVAFAVYVGADAVPVVSVATAVLVTGPGNVPPAPDAGAVKVTLAPVMTLLFASRTSALSGVPNALLIVALCGVPLVAAIEAAGPGLTVKLPEAFAVEIPP